MGLDQNFHEYFEALERAGNQDRCFLCRRTPAEVKRFFGFEEDGTPLASAKYGIEDVVLEATDIMSYRAERPICSVCQLNYDTIFALDEHSVLRRLLGQMEHHRDTLWPHPDPEP